MTLEITVLPGEGDSFDLSAKLTPGNQTWGHEKVERLFRDANIIPLVGTYILETNVHGTTIVSAPEGVDADDRRSIVWTMEISLDRYLNQLVEDLEAFPSAENITEAARLIVNIVSLGSFERGMLLDSTPVVDARTVKVDGVKCVYCGFDRIPVREPIEFLTRNLGIDDGIDDGVIKVGNLQFEVSNRDGVPIVLVGYLCYDSDFAGFLNSILADRVRAAIKAVALEEMTKILVNIELNKRISGRLTVMVQATYNIKSVVIAALVDRLENKARAELATSPEADDGGTDGDGTLTSPPTSRPPRHPWTETSSSQARQRTPHQSLTQVWGFTFPAKSINLSLLRFVAPDRFSPATSRFSCPIAS